MSEQPGKIAHHLFEELIHGKCGHKREEVSVPPQFGVDVAIVDLPGRMAMALTSDPLSLIPSLGLQESAWLSVHLMANDMATTGIAPMYGQFVLNLPLSLSREDFSSYWEYIHRFCAETGIAITGGHTGFTEGMHSTIAGGGTLVTIAPKSKMLVSGLARPGDSILVTKSCALSSTAILAMSFPETVKHKAGTEIHRQACESFYHTSALPDAICAVGQYHEYNHVTAMHDVTEGGVLGAIYELAVASGNGALIRNEQLPVSEVQSAICKAFDLDPRYCIGAGSMIITCRKGTAGEVINRMLKENIPCTEVGEICEQQEGIRLLEQGKETALVYMTEDPYWAAFFRAFQEGWK